MVSPIKLIRGQSRVAFVGLGQIGFPIAGQVAQIHKTRVFARTAATRDAHANQYGSVAAASIADAVADADLVVACLPHSGTVQQVVDAILGGACKPGAIMLDCTSGSMAQSQAYEKQLWEGKSVFYVDCAVSGGPAGAEKGILTSFIGGKEAAISEAEEVIGSYSKKQVHLGPAGSGHATKSINNILLATQNWAVSEGMAVLKKNGVDLHRALDAINESSGRSWSSIQRMPDNILSRKFDYGFSLGLHRKDCEAAQVLMRTEKGRMATPVLNQTGMLMNLAVSELGEDADHTQVAQLVEKWNDLRLE